MRSSSSREILRWYRAMQPVWINAVLLGTLAIIGGGLFIGITLNEPGQGNWAYAGAVILLGGVYVLIAGFRAGIGVARDGALVRSMLGRANWIPWPEIEKFEIVEPPHWRGDCRAIAVVRRGKRPLIADACSYVPWSQWTESNRKILQDLLRGLEDERTAAQRPLNGPADQDP